MNSMKLYLVTRDVISMDINFMFYFIILHFRKLIISVEF